jgi:hypothetical protein
MLTRIRGGVAGIGDYLRDGKKAGRSYERDELDDRLVLAGDLALTEQIIESLDTEGDRYLHVTLAFKEDEIDGATLKAIVDDFQAFAFGLYRPEEYNIYAEAHLPRIKSYIHGRTGDHVERKPHIHIVIPKTNLLSQSHASPFGLVPVSIDYLAAWQESVNYKYGLASPKDHRRVQFTDASEMISRYKADMFSGSNKDLRLEILDSVLQKNVCDFGAFQDLLSSYGSIRFRNAGKSSEYINLKMIDSQKGVNLKDYVFSRDFISLPTSEKRRLLSAEAANKYHSPGEKRKTPEECAAMLREWSDIRSRELKYINTGNKTFAAQYRAMSADEKRAVLDAREAAFYDKHEGKINEGRKPNIAGIGREPPPRARGRLLHLSELPVVRVGYRSEVLLPGDVPHNLEHQGAGEHQTVRRPLPGRSGRSDSVAGQMLRERQEAIEQRLAAPEIDQVKRELQASRLLASLAKSHGVVPDKYEVTTGKGGTDRIKCGTRNLNVADFLTREMNLPWKDAEQILRQTYAAQLDQVQSRVAGSPRRELWAQYQEWRKLDVPQIRSSAIDARRDERKAAIVGARQIYAVTQSQIESDPTLSKVDRRRLIDIAKATREHAVKAARSTYKLAEAAERARWSAKGDRLYSVFLAERVQQAPTGDLAEQALAELRKRQPDLATDDDLAGAFIRAADAQAQQAADQIHRSTIAPLSYVVDAAGHVTYSLAGRVAIKDEGRRLKVLQQDSADVIEEALMLSRAKFGPRLTLTGSAEFQRLAVQVAVDKGLHVDFVDPALQAIKIDMEAVRAAKRTRRGSGRLQDVVPAVSAEPSVPALPPTPVHPPAQPKADALVAFLASRQRTGVEYRFPLPSERFVGLVVELVDLEGRRAAIVDAGPNRDRSAQVHVVVQDAGTLKVGDRYKPPVARNLGSQPRQRGGR